MNPSIHNLQNPAVSRNYLTWQGVVGVGIWVTNFFRASISHLFPSLKAYPRYVTSVQHNWAFLADAWYPNSPHSTRFLVPCWHSSLVVAASSRSSTYYKSVSCGLVNLKEARSRCNASLNIVGEFLKLCGSLVHVNCPVTLDSGSCHLKAKVGWWEGCSLKQKKASFKSKTVYQFFSGGNELSRLYGFGTVGCISWILLLTPWGLVLVYNLVPGFLTGRRGVFQGDWHGTKMPSCKSLRIWGLIPSRASWLIGYCRTPIAVASIF